MTDEIQSAGLPVLEKKEATSLPTTLDSEPIDPEIKTDNQADAMHSAQLRTFLGQKLHPFDWRRQEAAQIMGLRFFKLTGALADEFRETQVYDGMFSDAAIVVWLCTINSHQVAKAIRMPAQATELRLKWAEDNIGGIGFPKHTEMMELFGEILGSYINSFAVEEKVPGKQKEE